EHDLHRQSFLLRHRVREIDALASVAVDAGVDRQYLRFWVQQAQRQGAPAHRIADRENASRTKPREKAFQKIDLLNRDPEPVGQALAIFYEPGEGGERVAAEMARVKSRRQF